MDNELRPLLKIDVRNLYEHPINHDVAERYLTILQTCRCCNRHQCRKPHSIYDWAEYPTSDLHDETCECNCRYLARHICRAINYQQHFLDDKKHCNEP